MSQVDERLIDKGGIISKLPALLVFGITIAIYGIGIYSLYNYLIVENPETTSLIGGVLSAAFLIVKDNLPFFGMLIAIIFGVTILGMVLVLKFLSWLGKEVLIIGSLILPLGLLGGGGYLYFTDFQPIELSYVLAAIGAIMFLIWFFVRKRLSLAGDFIEFSAKAIYAESGTILVSLFFSIFALTSFVMDYTASLWVWNNIVSTWDNFWLQSLGMFGFFLLSAWVLWSALYFSEGVIVAVVDDWYRNPESDKASVGKGVKKALRVVGGIVWLGLIMAFFDTIGKAARAANEKAQETKNPVIIFGSLIFRFIAWLMKWIAEVLTYFALPALVIERLRFGAAVKRSYKLLTKNLVDVLIANTLVGGIYGLFFVGLLLFYGGSGFAIGNFFITSILTLAIDPLYVSIGTAIAFFGFGFIPAMLMLRPLFAAYKTIMYEYALDRESNFTLPSRMSEKMRRNADDVIRNPPTTKRWRQVDIDGEGKQEEMAMTSEQPSYQESSYQESSYDE